MQRGNFLESRDHFHLVFAVKSFLNSEEVVPHIKGISVVAKTLEESGEERDDFFKEGMIPVALHIGNHRLENSIEGHLDALGHLLTHLHRLHGQQGVDQDSFVQEVVRFDFLPIMLHIRQHLQSFVTILLS